MSKWDDVRALFKLDPGLAHFETLVFASHPLPVDNAIEDYREKLDVQAYEYFRKNAGALRLATLEALRDYFGVEVGLGAVTYGTTLGLAQILGGVRMVAGDEFLTSVNAHPATMDTLRFRRQRDGIAYRQTNLFADSQRISVQEILDKLQAAIDASTRVLTLDWVCSCDGVKLPVRQIAGLVTKINRQRARSGTGRRLLFVVDGVHGFGIENTTFPDLSCDFFIAGCHKSVFGPRGTGVICGRRDAWEYIDPWIAKLSSAKEGPASQHVPGGVHTYEHWWALGSAFRFHLDTLLKPDVQDRIWTTATMFKHRLAAIPGVRIISPMTSDFSSGIVCLDIRDKQASDVLDQLRDAGVMASESPPDGDGNTHVRFAVSVLNDSRDIERAYASVRRIAGP